MRATTERRQARATNVSITHIGISWAACVPRVYLRRVGGPIGVVDAEALGIPNTIMVDGLFEEDKVEEETVDVVELVGVAGEERVVAIVEIVEGAGEDEKVAKLSIADDDGILEIVVAVEIVDEDEIVEASDGVVAGGVE